MAEKLFFAHANGFPSGTYGKLFQALAPQYEVACLAVHGHDPRFPVTDNWPHLVQELIHHLQAQPGPVWGLGHSLGGALHVHAALLQPGLYRGLILLDSPLLAFWERWAVRLAKRVGLIDRITPAGRTLGRREYFADVASARAYFASKGLFRDFDPDCLEAYLRHGLRQQAGRLCLRFEAATEISIYRSVPHRVPAPLRQLQLPVALVRGARSDVVAPYHGRLVRSLPRGEYHCVAGGHMFPLEQPLRTAGLIRELLARWQGCQGHASLAAS
ncbi:alpha/beta fold hydrolase [Pseudomonas typographi]|uniref:alpha/beta fold hydrolase n=1 Tax=Pseudomonas typographi TaxID=2715964 RepID=UPI00168A3D49|nr:alpha/beta hydrolase [Pseudomonas typographi]MBD1552005.1 alpha/beta hydrolase [Pseudomonas typographi]MBD1586568.1 alpha/beta hydrolase [Pseudomonas typographi]